MTKDEKIQNLELEVCQERARKANALNCSHEATVITLIVAGFLIVTTIVNIIS